MQKRAQFWAIGVLLIFLAVMLLAGMWFHFGVGQGKSSVGHTVTPTAKVKELTCRGGWMQTSIPVESVAAKNIPLNLEGLVVHWNGMQWLPVQTVETQGEWTAIAALSAHDVWVIGQADGKAKVLRWDSEMWTSTALSAPGVVTLAGIVEVASNDVWVVGSSRSRSGAQSMEQALIWHWDGTSWHSVAVNGEPEGSDVVFTSISAAAADDIWALGTAVSGAGLEQNFVEHWDGSRWQEQPLPMKTSAYRDITLKAIVAVAADNVWVVGAAFPTNGDGLGGANSLIEHWNGKAWSIEPIANPEDRSSELVAIKAISANNIWAAGSFKNVNTGLDNTYMQHWDGKQWEMVIWPVVYGQLEENASVMLADVSGTSDGLVIGVGSSIVYTQNPPIDDADRMPMQPFVLESCK
jgi:hypothetical protein